MEKKTFPFDQELTWYPDEKSIRQSNTYRFYQKLGLKSYDDFYDFSIKDVGQYWDKVLSDIGILFDRSYSKILDLQNGKPFPKWCIGGKINIYNSCLNKWIRQGHGNRKALIYEDEAGKQISLTYDEVDEKSGQLAAAFKALGLGKNDVIALYMPMSPEILIAFMAIIRIGAIILPLFSGYGPSAISTRLNDSQAKALIFTDITLRRGKKVSLFDNLKQAIDNSNTVKFIFGAERISGITTGDFPDYCSYFNFDHLIQQQNNIEAPVVVDAEEHVMLIYTSGTTGKPKGAVHSHVGFPIKAAHDLRYNFDLQTGDILFWFTDMGWMMGPWEVFGALLNGATMVFYEGAPDFPDASKLWQMVDKYKITHLGISPNLVRSLKEYGAGPILNYDLSSLRLAGSTGSPWDPESWIWFFKNVLGGTKPIINYSGGTEISGGIICGNLFKGLKPCAFSGPMPGMDVDVVDMNGDSVKEAVGELVIKQPWMGMTLGFWNDSERYLESYWRYFREIWRHGDYAAIDKDGLYFILGRSDDTIKISGKRVGPAEIEGILNSHPQVIESAAIAVPHPVKDNEVVVFCVLNRPENATEALREELIILLTNELGKPLKPREIRFCSILPKTRNAKIMRRIIRAVYLDESVGDISSLEDPDALDAIRHAR